MDGEIPPGRHVPKGALPLCRECAKPELRADNLEAARLYVEVQDQQTFAGMTGARMGIRYEALLAAGEALRAEGEIGDVAEAMRGARIMDAAVNDSLNKEATQSAGPKDWGDGPAAS